jgi:hypothetical protein
LNFTITKEQGPINCKDFCNDYTIKVYFGGVEVFRTISYNLDRLFDISIDPQLIANIYRNTSGKANETINFIFERNCDFVLVERIRIDIPIQIVTTGENYTQTTTDIRVEGPVCESFDTTEPYICCNDIKSISYSI